MKMVFAGSFDPVTKGHMNIISRILPLCDTLYVALLNNESKKGYFSKEQRLSMLKKACEGFPGVVVESYDGLLKDYCLERGIQVSVRGVRNTRDFEYEKDMAEMNARIGGPETLLIYADPNLASVSSSAVRELISFGEDVTEFLPDGVVFEQKKIL